MSDNIHFGLQIDDTRITLWNALKYIACVYVYQQKETTARYTVTVTDQRGEVRETECRLYPLVGQTLGTWVECTVGFIYKDEVPYCCHTIIIFPEDFEQFKDNKWPSAGIINLKYPSYFLGYNDYSKSIAEPAQVNTIQGLTVSGKTVEIKIKTEDCIKYPTLTLQELTRDHSSSEVEITLVGG